MKPPPRIHLAPAHPCMGWVSMNRCWQALLMESAHDPDVSSLVAPVPVETAARPFWQRQWTRRIAYPWLVRTQVKSGVLHVLDHSFAGLLAQVRAPVRSLVTVHDLIPLTDPGDLSPAQQKRFLKDVSWISRADKVVCVSHHTASEVQRHFAIPDAKLHVIPNGTTRLPAPDVHMRQKLGALPPFILSVGGSRPRKNLHLLAPLAAHLASQGHRATFVRAGAPLDSALAAGIRQHAELHELGSISDAELAAAYAQAALTLVPSTHEGFGLPVLEAMGSGCPVVHSLSTSLPEVAGDAGLGFDATDAAMAARHCYRILNDPALRTQMITAGRQRATHFTWKAHWLALREIYTGLLQS